MDFDSLSDEENLQLDGPAIRAMGRPTVDYKKMYLALELRCKRAGLSVQSPQPFKKQMISLCENNSMELAKQLKEKDLKIEKLGNQNNHLLTKTGALGNGSKPYSKKSSGRQRILRKKVEKLVVVNSTQPVTEKAAFVTDMVRYSGNKVQILESLTEFFEDKKIASIIQEDIMNKAVCHVSRSEMVRTRDFVERKRMQISKSKRQQSNRVQKTLTAAVSSQVTLHPVVVPCYSATDNAARAHLRNAFPLMLPSAIKDDSIKVEHALLDTVAMIKCGLCNFLTVEELGANWVWFYSGKLQSYKYLHVELSTFFDSTPFGSNGDSCTGLYVRFINAPGVIHKPEFTYILYLCKTKETSALSERLLRRYSDHLVRIIRGGLKLTLAGFTDDRTLPKSTIPVNGTHSVTFGMNNFAADGKAQLWAGGCKGGNSTFTPEYTHHQEEMVNPNFPVNMNSYITLAFRRILYYQVHQFRQLQHAEYKKIAINIKTDNKMTQADKTSKLVSEYDRLMVRGVRAEAIRLKTGCVHFEPFDIAEDTTPCPLHMDTNEYLRVLIHIVKVSAKLTLDHFCIDPQSRFVKFSGRGKAHGTTYPDISRAPPDSPLVKAIQLLRSIKMKKFADNFVKLYTPPVNQTAATALANHENPDMQQEDDDWMADLDALLGMDGLGSTPQKDSQRIRMIGENIETFSPNAVLLVLCLKPINGIWPDGKLESTAEFRERLVCHSYVHLLRSLSAMLSTWILVMFRDEHGIQLLGDLFVLLVHHFKLHKSYNTFLFSQVSPFKVKRNMFRYQLSPSHSLNIGNYGKNQGGEGNQKVVKEHYLKWTDKKTDAFVSLLNQTVEVYVGGTNLFPETCPDRVDLESENTKSWLVRFGKKKVNHCHACNQELVSETQTLVAGLANAHFSNSSDFGPSAIMNHLDSSVFQHSAHSSMTMFSLFLHLSFDVDKFYCDECCSMAQLLFALYSGKHKSLLW